MLFFTPHERRALIFLGAAFFCGLCLDIGFKLYPPGYEALQVLDRAPERARVDINRASYEDLVTVAGIGPSTAARIIYAREKAGRFASLEDIRAIKGFSKKSFARASARLSVGAP